MSQHGHEEPHGHQAEDEIQYGKIIKVGVVSLAIFAVATVWAAIIMSKHTKQVESETGVATKPSEIGRSEIGIVDQVPFVIDHRLEVWRAERSAHLNGYGWVDRAKGVAHVPIEKALDAVATGALPAGAPR
jgi:hypothetical protein